MTPNMSAFLTMIAHSEGVDQAPDPYRVCYGYKHTIIDMNYHPSERRPDGSIEWGGEKLPDKYCINLGFSPGCVSTAAGRYQINRPTWIRLKGILTVTGFWPDAQDDCAVQLIKEKGALNLVNSGMVEEAINACHATWASLPGNLSGQPQRSFADLINAYGEAGGSFA